MKIILILLITLFFFCCSCHEKKNTSISNSSDKYRDSSFNFIMKKFGLPYSENSKLDSNSLVFYCTRSFDTSFLIHLKHSVPETHSVYYEVLPTYHNNVNSFAVEGNQLLYFEGYSFTLDSIKWEIIKQKAENMLANDTSFKNNAGCRDCEEYVLCYNLKSSKSHIDNNAKYKSFYKFLKELFLENFIQKRKPIMHMSE